MNTRNPFLPLLSFTCATITAAAQGNFQNLDFESANLAPVPAGQYGGFVPISDALPGWTAYFGTNPVTQILHNNLTLGAQSIDIFGPNWTSGVIIAGLYTVVLQPGASPPNPPVTVSLAQTALVPASAQSIRLKIDGQLSISLGGQPIPLVQIGSGSNYTLYGGDISQFAGQVAELRLTTFLAFSGFVPLDDIEFSSLAIPEPGVPALSALGVLVFGWSLVRKRRQ